MVKCYNLVFSLNNKLNNIGFLVFSILLLFEIIFYIYYCINGISSIKIFLYREMEKFNYTIKIQFPNKKSKNKNIIKSKKYSSLLHLSSSIRDKSETKRPKKSQKCQKILKNNKNYIQTQKTKIKNPLILIKCKYNNKIININNHNIGLLSNTNLKHSYDKIKIKKKEKILSNEDNKKYPGYYNLIRIDAKNSLRNNYLSNSKYILDNYDFENSIKYDKRSFCRIFYICLLSKENILNTFYFKSPLEIQIIRLSLFIFNYACDFSLNALFYLDQNISDKYHYKGNNLFWFSLLNNIVISITSTIIGFILVICLNLLTNSKDSIEEIFRNEEEKLFKNKNYKLNKNTKQIIHTKIQRIFKLLKIKIFFYIIFQLVLILFFLYYVAAFCEVYKDTQISWITDSVVSFIISIPIAFSLSFFISILYIISLRFKIKILYNISIFLYGLG